MALPKPALPIFNLKVPSTGKTVKYRQFTVREEKAMIQAQQSEDLEIILNAVKEIISACVTGIDDVDELALFDIEYLITKIRAKSVGEKIELRLLCDIDETHTPTPVLVDVDRIEVKFPEGHTKTIPLYDDVGVVMKYPNIKTAQNIGNLDGLDLIVSTIDYIYTADEVFHSKDSTKEELLEFLNNLTITQIEKIEQSFLKTMPTYTHTLTYKCKDCGYEHQKTIKGLASFFV